MPRINPEIELKSWHTCAECGKKAYPNADSKKMTGITVMGGTCPDCGKGGTLIPISDFEYASGDDTKWD